MEKKAKYFCVRREVPLQQKLPSDSETVRKLDMGEAFQVIDGPKEEKVGPCSRVKVVSTRDGATGWATVRANKVRAWTAKYKVAVPTPMHDQLDPENAKEVSKLTLGEEVEILEDPVEHGKEIRAKCKSSRNKAVGFVSLRNAEGKVNLNSQ